jgi:hypothetical protein
MWEHLDERLVVYNDKIRDSDGQDHPSVQPTLSRVYIYTYIYIYIYIYMSTHLEARLVVDNDKVRDNDG